MDRHVEAGSPATGMCYSGWLRSHRLLMSKVFTDKRRHAIHRCHADIDEQELQACSKKLETTAATPTTPPAANSPPLVR